MLLAGDSMIGLGINYLISKSADKRNYGARSELFRYILLGIIGVLGGFTIIAIIISPTALPAAAGGLIGRMIMWSVIWWWYFYRKQTVQKYFEQFK